MCLQNPGAQTRTPPLDLQVFWMVSLQSLTSASVCLSAPTPVIFSAVFLSPSPRIFFYPLPNHHCDPGGTPALRRQQWINALEEIVFKQLYLYRTHCLFAPSLTPGSNAEAPTPSVAVFGFRE